MDHKQRPSNQAFAMQFLAQFKHYPELAEGETHQGTADDGREAKHGGQLYGLRVAPGEALGRRGGTTYTTITRAKARTPPRLAT